MWCKPVQTTEEALTARLLQGATQALELYGIFLGKELGLYDVLRSGARVTASELAAAAGIDSRYAREWLEQQAVAGLLLVEESSAAAEARRYWLPAEHTNVLAEEDHPAHLAPLAQMVAGIGGALDRVVAAYRTGSGVAYQEFGGAFRRGQSGINRPAFLNDLVNAWIPAMPDVHAALGASVTRVADIGCGAGWSTIAMARAYPYAEVIGFDADEASVNDARQNAGMRGVSVRFAVRDAETVVSEGPFDLVLVLEALHDMSRPREVLQAVRQALAPGGSVLVADEKVADHFHAPADDLERLMYGWSIVHCLPVSRAEQPSAAIGTVIRPETVRSLAAEAGYTQVDVLPVDGGFFRLYRLRAN
jgi:2-polyprenyl-3-methyl-5-hydroxy-6-metoxy-1,4-benzoquinol methylase